MALWTTTRCLAAVQATSSRWETAGWCLHQNDSDLQTGGTGAHWSFFSSIALDRRLRGVWLASLTSVFIVGDQGLFFRGVR